MNTLFRNGTALGIVFIMSCAAAQAATAPPVPMRAVPDYGNQTYAQPAYAQPSYAQPSYAAGVPPSPAYAQGAGAPVYGQAAPAQGYGQGAPAPYGQGAPDQGYGQGAPAPVYGQSAPAQGNAAPSYAQPPYGAAPTYAQGAPAQGNAPVAPTYASGGARAAGNGSVRDTIEMTLRNNPSLKAMQEYRQAAAFDVVRAGNGYFPRVDLRAGAGMEQWSDSTTRNPTYSQTDNRFYPRADASLTVTQNIWDGFATASRVGISEAMLISAEHRLIDNAEVLSLDAALAHIEVCRQRKLLALAESNLSNHQNILASQMERQAAGVANLSDVTQTQARVARSESTLAETRAALQNAMSNYKRITGSVPSGLTDPAEPGYAFTTLDNALAQSMTANAKVLSKRADVDGAYAQKELDKAALHPRLYLEASPSYSYQAGSSDSYSWGTNVQLRGEWNIFNGGYDKHTLNGNKARIRQGNRELQALRDSLAKETEDTWVSWQAAQELSSFYGNAVLYSTQTRDMYLDQFNVGQRSLMDLLDSENELYSSTIQLVTAQMNVIASQYRLLALNGKLLSHFAVDKTRLKVETNQDDYTENDMTGTTINNHAFTPDEGYYKY